ncbi:MAG: hypothetical protein HYS44_02775 [Candidatus Niyogibacteria bacterium]|nr:hypothetical protein [Candidatus Niyogibacteria bacterium]
MNTKGETLRREQGFLQLIVILVLLVVILSLLGVSLSALFENKMLQENFGFVGRALSFAWNEWLQGPIVAIGNTLWSGVIREFLWEPFRNFFFSLKGGGNLFSK